MEPKTPEHAFYERPSTPADHVYFDGAVQSWDKQAGENKATLGIIQPGFDEVFEVGAGGEDICLNNPDDANKLLIDLLDAEGRVIESHVIEGSAQASFPDGHSIRVRTPDDQGEVAYRCVYPGQRFTD